MPRSFKLKQGRPTTNNDSSPFDILIVLLALKSTGIHETYVSFLGDLCEIFSWEKYGADAHEIDIHPLESLNSLEDVDPTSEARKAKVNPISKLFLTHFFQCKWSGAVKVKETSRGLIACINTEIEKQKEFYLSFPRNLKLFRQIRNFIDRNIGLQPDPRYGIEYVMDIANSMAKRSITAGDIVYLVEKNSVVLNTLKQVFSQLVGLGALINNDAADSLIEKINDKLMKKWNPYFKENYQKFLDRALKDKLHPIRICARCTDIRKERNKIILYLEGDGAVRVYTYKDCYKMMNWYDLDEAMLTIDGIPYRNHGMPVLVALKIIRRKPPDICRN